MTFEAKPVAGIDHMKTLSLGILACFLLLGVTSETKAQAVGIDKLSAYIGKWKSTGTILDTAYSKAATASSETNCQWSANHGFMICDQLVYLSAEVHNDVSIYTYDPKAGAFAFVGISRDAPRPRTPKLTIEGNIWTYSNEFDDGPKHIRFRTVNEFTSANSITWRSEYSADGLHWTITGSGNVTRVPS